MPRTGAPPMIGETPTTVLAATAARMPGTARIVPTLTTGLDGGRITTSAASIASSTPGAGLASSAPTAAMLRRGHLGVQAHPPFLEVDRPVGRSASSTTTCVSTRSSVIGSRRTPGFQRSHSASVTADSG